MGNRVLVVLGLVLLLVASCLPDPLEVKGVPTIKPKIVVSTQYIPNEGLVVLLTKSFGALEADDDSDPQALLAQIAVADARVVLSNNTQTDTLVNLLNGFYGNVHNSCWLFIISCSSAFWLREKDSGVVCKTETADGKLHGVGHLLKHNQSHSGLIQIKIAKPTLHIGGIVYGLTQKLCPPEAVVLPHL